MKKITLAIILTLLVNILSLPLWTEYDYGGFVRTLFNKESRLVLGYQGMITGAEPFLFQACPAPITCSHTYGGNGDARYATLVVRTRGRWQKFSLQLQALQDGKISMVFTGPEVRDEYGQLYSVLTDWKDLKINGKVIFKGTKTFSLTKVFAQQIPVKKGGVYHIEAEIRRHYFSIHDFKFLKSGNLWFLIAGNLLVFFSIYRLLFLMIKYWGRIGPSDTMLISTFFAFLFIPTIYISDATLSTREGRKLAVKPTWKEVWRGNKDTGGGYGEWLNDHFCGRTVLIKLHDVIRNMLSYIIRAKKGIYFKEGGWFFSLPLEARINRDPVVIESIVQNVVKLNDFCQKNQIKLYVMESPSKETVYKEFLSEKYGFDEKTFARTSQVQEIIRSKVRKHHIPWIYPCEALRNASKQDFVYFKWTHHWTDWGAFVSYRELMKEVNRNFPDMPVVSLSDCRKSRNRLIRDEWFRLYRLGLTHSLFNFSDDPSNRVLYNYYDHKNADKMVVQVGRFTKNFAYPEGKHRVMLVGSSMNDSFIQFLPYSAVETKYIRVNMGQAKDSDLWKILKLYRNDILTFKPEILVLSIPSGSLPRMCDLISTK